MNDIVGSWNIHIWPNERARALIFICTCMCVCMCTIRKSHIFALTRVECNEFFNWCLLHMRRFFFSFSLSRDGHPTVNVYEGIKQSLISLLNVVAQYQRLLVDRARTSIPIPRCCCHQSVCLKMEHFIC